MKKAMKRKMLIAIVAILSISAFGMTLLSYISSAEHAEQKQYLAANNGDTFGKNMIDLIIDNSNGLGTEDDVYHIVELSSSGTPSALGTMVSNGVFKDHVLDGHRSVMENKFKEGKLEYQCFAASSTDNKTLDAVKKADFVYLSNDYTGAKFAAGNDISEDMKILLASLATGSYIPFMIDGHIKSHESAVVGGTTYKIFTSNVLKPEGALYRSYAWKSSDEASVFFNPNNLASPYVYINGTYQDSNQYWHTISTNAGDTLKMSKVLTIKSGDSDTALTSKIRADLGAKFDYKTEAKHAEAPKEGEAPTQENLIDGVLDAADIYRVAGSSAVLKAYHPMKRMPNLVMFDTVDIAASAGLDGRDLASYDIIIVEGGTAGQPMSNEMQGAMTSAMMANVHILYNSSLNESSGSDPAPENSAKNYKYVLDKVATANETPVLSNVLVSTRAKVSGFAAAKRPKAVDAVADIILNGSFRGMGSNNGNGGSSNLYTVLEIQPGYPIDLTLAKQLGDIKGKTDPLSLFNGTTMAFDKQSRRHEGLRGDGGSKDPNGSSFYYLRTASVSSDIADEITYDGVTSLTTMKDSGNFAPLTDEKLNENYAKIYDYYSWTMTKAKVAQAANLPIDKVNVVHMSSTEFNSSKASLLDNYDCIYIGGDNSSIKTDPFWKSSKYYRMYFHDGDVYDTQKTYDGFANGQQGAFMGNDISYVKMKELEEYISAGMPVVFDQDLCVAYANVDTPDQKLLDPYSNMRALLDEAKKREYNPSSGAGNVLLNFDSRATMKIDNSSGELGTTLNGYATVFRGTSVADSAGNLRDLADRNQDGNLIDYKWDTVGDNSGYYPVDLDISSTPGDELANLLNKSSKRPRLLVTKQPSSYKEGDDSSWIKFTTNNRKLTFECEATNADEVYVITDENSDSRFTGDPDDAVFNGSIKGGKGVVEIDVKSSFFGPVYWKLVVRNSTTGLTASTTGLFKVARNADQNKAEVRLLQIQPVIEQGEGNKSTLYLCNECQQSKGLIIANRVASGNGKYTHDVATGLSAGYRNSTAPNLDGSTTAILNSTGTVVNDIKREAASRGDSYNYVGNILGVHEHKFGIVKYDDNRYYPGANTEYQRGIDNWNTNWFADVKEDYDVQMDIMSVNQFHDLVADMEAEGKQIMSKGADLDEMSILLQENYAKYHELDETYTKHYKIMRKIINGEMTADDWTSDDLKRVKLLMLESRNNRFISDEAVYNAQEADRNAFLDSLDATQIAVITEGGNLTGAALTAAYVKAFVATKTEAYMLDKKIAQFTTAEQKVIDDLLTAYSKSNADIDTFLKNNYKAGVAGSSAAPYSDEELAYQTNPETAGTDRPYYDLFSVMNNTNSYSTFYSQLASKYIVWRDAKIWEQYFKSTATEYRTKAAFYYDLPKEGDSQERTAELKERLGKVDLGKIYNCIAIGAADYFNGKDLVAKEDCDALLEYMAEDGSVFLFHDALTAEADSTVNMTKYLSKAFGQNPRRQVAKTGKISYAQDGMFSIEIYKDENSLKNGKGELWALAFKGSFKETDDIVKIKFGNMYDSSNLPRIVAETVQTEGVSDQITINLENEDGSVCNDTKYLVFNGDYGNAVAIRNGSKVNTSVTGTYYVTDGDSKVYRFNELKRPNLSSMGLTLRAGIVDNVSGGDANEVRGLYKYVIYSKISEDANQLTYGDGDALLEIHNGAQTTTDKATQNNEGIVTLYPFNIGSRLQIAPTSPQGYALDVEDPDMTVYYSLSGGTSGTISSLMAATPNDGTNNYFLYQYHSVTYTGAGHSNVTGYHRNNNDERRLFINVILNVARPSLKGADLKLYDVDSKLDDGTGKAQLTNKIVKRDPTKADDYVRYVEGYDEIPDFSYIATTDAGASVARVEIFWDLSREKDENGYYYDANRDIKIFDTKKNGSYPYVPTNEFTKENIGSGMLKAIKIPEKDGDDTRYMYEASSALTGFRGPALTPQESYFKDGKAYIVVKVTDSNDAVTSKTMRVELKPERMHLN